MDLIGQVKRGQFLRATCDFSQPFVTGEWVLDSGLHCQLLYRGVLQITPRELASDAKDIVLSSGIHGDETSPIELIQQIASGVVLGHIQPVHRLLLIIAHPEAINHQQRFMADGIMSVVWQTPFNWQLTAFTVPLQRLNLIDGILIFIVPFDLHSTTPLQSVLIVTSILVAINCLVLFITLNWKRYYFQISRHPLLLGIAQNIMVLSH